LDRAIIFESPKWDLGGCFAFIAKETGLKVDNEVAFFISKGIDNSLAYRLGWDVQLCMTTTIDVTATKAFKVA